MMDQALESRIDNAGRELVFMRAMELGWFPGSSPDRYIWEGICREIEDVERVA